MILETAVLKRGTFMLHCWSDTGDSGINVGTFMEHCWSDTGDSGINVGHIYGALLE